MNWKRIIVFAAVLLGSELLIGFAEGGLGVADQGSAQAHFFLSTSASFLLATAIFWFMATRQGRRPFVHAGLALLVMVALSLVLAAVVSTWLGGKFYMVLVAAEWFTLLVAMVVGTSAGRLMRGRSRGSAADA